MEFLQMIDYDAFITLQEISDVLKPWGYKLDNK